MGSSIATTRLLLAALAATFSGCAWDDGSATADAPVSRGANGDCLKAWNAPGNATNQKLAASEHRGWSVALSRWSVDHAPPDPSGDDLVGAGCSYFFSSATRWRSYSGGWEADGDLRWEMTHEASGPRTREQRLELPNAFLDAQGKLMPLSGDNDPAVSDREWRAVIDDWYEDGRIDRSHRCAAVRAAIERVPPHGPSITTAHADLLEYADQVCPP